MTEEVIGQLAQVRGLKVISRTSTEALNGTRLSMRQIADTLGVRHILEGFRHGDVGGRHSAFGSAPKHPWWRAESNRAQALHRVISR
jgi:hypothetical protein